MNLAPQIQPLLESKLSSNIPVKLAITPQNQVQIQLGNAQAGQSSVTPSNSAQAPSALILTFARAQTTQTNQIVLDRPVSTPLTSKEQVAPANQPNTLSNQVTRQQINLSQFQNTAALHTTGSQYVNQNQGAPLSQVSVTQSPNIQLPQVAIDSAKLTANESNVNSLVKNILSQSFPQKQPMSQHLTGLHQKVKNLQQQLSRLVTPLLADKKNSLPPEGQRIVEQSNTLIKQVNQLLQSVQRPHSNRPNLMADRIRNSGNLMESKLNQLSSTMAKQPVNPLSRTAALVKENLISNLKPSQTNSEILANRRTETATKPETVISSDLKLKLVQIKANVEKLLYQLTQLSNNNQSTTNARTPTSLVTPAQNSQVSPQNSESMIRTPEGARLELTQNSANINQPANRLLQRPGPYGLLFNSVTQLNQVTKSVSDINIEARNALNQVELNQLLSIRTEQPNLHQFLVDLPFAHAGKIDSFELLFEHKNDPKQEATKQWKVVVKFDLQPLGPMFAQIELKDNRISTDIFAESQATARLINDHLHVLQKSLFEAGIDTDKIASSQGKIPEQLIKTNEHSVDIRV